MNHPRVIAITFMSVGLLSTILFSSSMTTAFIPSSATTTTSTTTTTSVSLQHVFIPKKKNTQTTTTTTIIRQALRDRNDQSTPSNFARTRHNHLHNDQRVNPSTRRNNSPTRIGSITTQINRSLPKYSVPTNNNNDTTQPDNQESEDTTTISSSTSSSTTTASTNTPSFDDKIAPPSNYDPSQFDSFADGDNWSTNVNNPFVAAKYVRFRRAASVTSDHDVTQRLHDSMEEEATKKRRDAWVQARELEQKADELREEMMMGMNGGMGGMSGSTTGGGSAMEEAAKKRREAWSKARKDEDESF